MYSIFYRGGASAKRAVKLALHLLYGNSSATKREGCTNVAMAFVLSQNVRLLQYALLRSICYNGTILLDGQQIELIESTVWGDSVKRISAIVGRGQGMFSWLDGKSIPVLMRTRETRDSATGTLGKRQRGPVPGRRRKQPKFSSDGCLFLVELLDHLRVHTALAARL